MLSAVGQSCMIGQRLSLGAIKRRAGDFQAKPLVQGLHTPTVHTIALEVLTFKELLQHLLGYVYYSISLQYTMVSHVIMHTRRPG